MKMSLAVDDISRASKGKKALAIEACSKSLKALPTIIAENAGYDSADLIQNLRSEIFNGNKVAGLNMFKGTVDSMTELGVTECLRVKEQAIISASEAAEMILRVDEIIKCAPRKREMQ